MIIKRILSQRTGHIISLLAYVLDLFSVVAISMLLDSTNINGLSLIHIGIILSVVILIRITSLLLLKNWAYRKFYELKTDLNKILISNTLKNTRRNEPLDLDNTREKLIFSSEIAVVNFDIPLSLLIGEIIVLSISTIYIFFIIDITLYLAPAGFVLALIVLLYFVIIKEVAKLGKDQIRYQESKINWITNILSIVQSLGLNKSSKFVVAKHLHNENLCNKTTVKMMIINQLTTLLVEFAMLMLAIIVILNSNGLGQLVSLTPLAARVAPSISKISSYFSQLAFGIQAVVKNG
jgi:hypothetical protein